MVKGENIMSKIIVLGGCGAVGNVVVRALADHPAFDEVVIGDFNIKRAEEIAAELGNGITAVKFDGNDAASIKAAIKGCDMVMNCVGPFYKTVKTILSTVIEAGINYVDICDDVDVTLEILEWDRKAKDAGITAMIGMGNSPGATNVFAKFAYDYLLDETDSVDIFHTHGGEPFEGPGVIGHRFHCMSIDIPMYLDGKIEYVKYFEPDGIALRQTFAFPIVGECPLYPYPHPEQVTMPKYMKLNRVTNKGGVLPNEYYEMTRDLCGLGMADKEPIEVNGTEVAPADFAMAYLIKRRDEILKKVNFGSQKGCCTTVVKGKKAGKSQEIRFHMASESSALGEGTGLPAAMGAILMLQGKIQGPGVYPPEGCVDPNDFLAISKEMVLKGTGEKEESTSSAIIVELIDENGKVSKMDI